MRETKRIRKVTGMASPLLESLKFSESFRTFSEIVILTLQILNGFLIELLDFELNMIVCV